MQQRNNFRLHFTGIKVNRTVFACFRPVNLGGCWFRISIFYIFTQIDTDIGRWSERFSGSGVKISQEFI